MRNLYYKIVRHKAYALLLSITIITTFFMVISFEYCDLDSLTAWSVNVWDSLFEGRLLDFYDYCILNLRGAAHSNCAGNFLWLLPWSVWNFPIWIVHTITGELLVTDFWCLCWSKLFLVFLSAITAKITYDICMYLINDRKKCIWSYLLVLASPELLMSIGYAGQDEIVYLAAFMGALLYWIKGDMIKFLLLSVCSVTFCPIMLIPVIALLLIKEKNIAKIILYVIVQLVPLAIFELIFRNNLVYQEAKTDFGAMIEDMLSLVSINTLFGEVSVVGIILVVIYFWCYSMREEEKTIYFLKSVVYIMTLIFVLISTFMNNNFYRHFLYLPVLIILVLTSDINFNMNILLLTVLSWSRSFLVCTGSMNTIYTMKNSWLTRLCDAVGSDRYNVNLRLLNYITSIKEYGSVIMMMVLVIAIASAIILLIINLPQYKKKHAINIDIRVCIGGYVICMPVFLLCFYKTLL